MSLTLAQILAHAAGELDICPACGRTGKFGTVTNLLGQRVTRCPHCKAEQIELEDLNG